MSMGSFYHHVLWPRPASKRIRRQSRHVVHEGCEFPKTVEYGHLLKFCDFNTSRPIHSIKKAVLVSYCHKTSIERRLKKVDVLFTKCHKSKRERSTTRMRVTIFGRTEARYAIVVASRLLLSHCISQDHLQPF
jgi:hypothetical protein